MIFSTLRADVDRFAAHFQEHNPAFRRAIEGELPPRAAMFYLRNIERLLEFTPIHLERACRRAEELGRTQLASFFRHKKDEEAGHAEWARADRAGLSGALGLDSGDVESETLNAMLSFIETEIDSNPERYLAYIFFAEYFTILLGPGWLRHLEERCGIPSRFMTAIANHVELDQEHVQEHLSSLDRLVADPSSLTALRATLHGAMEHFDAFGREVATIA